MAEAFVPIKLQFVTYNTYIYTSEIKNDHLVAPKNPCDFGKVYYILQMSMVADLHERHLKFFHLSFGTDKTTIFYAKYIHTYTSEMKIW